LITYLLYNTAILLLLPVLALWMLWRVVVSRKADRSWRQQLGFLPRSLARDPSKKRVWLHAVSVGEAVAGASIVSEVRSLLPGVEIVVSTTTQTGQAMAMKSIQADHFVYFPIDLPPAVKGSIDFIRPDVFASMETEIWPNFLFYMGLRRIPCAVLNGVISDKTFVRGRQLRGMFRTVLKSVHGFCMQTEEDARRIKLMGADSGAVRVVGNTKFDQAVEPLSDAEREVLAAGFGISPGDEVFVAGSTNPGEDEQVLDAFRLMREARPGIKMIIAPRQIERAGEIGAMAAALGFSWGRRSVSGDLEGGRDVAILDTFGELASVYALGQAGFVGGTLIRKGGHNILQPIAQGIAVFYGPHTFKTRDLVRIAEDGQVGFGVIDSADLAGKVTELLSDAQGLREIRSRASALIESNRGASRRCAEAIAELVAER
jgi:3-deoxy-D-manno-octulosonic-acid transferase